VVSASDRVRNASSSSSFSAQILDTSDFEIPASTPSAWTRSSTFRVETPWTSSLDHDGVESLIDAATPLQDRGEEAALPDLRDLEGEIPRFRRHPTRPRPVATSRPRQPPLVKRSADVLGGLGIDQGLVEEGHHLGHEIDIGMLMQSIGERGQVKLLVGHRSISFSCLLKGHAENAPMARLLGGPSK